MEINQSKHVFECRNYLTWLRLSLFSCFWWILSITYLYRFIKIYHFRPLCLTYHAIILSGQIDDLTCWTGPFWISLFELGINFYQVFFILYFRDTLLNALHTIIKVFLKCCSQWNQILFVLNESHTKFYITCFRLFCVIYPILLRSLS